MSLFVMHDFVFVGISIFPVRAVFRLLKILPVHYYVIYFLFQFFTSFYVHPQLDSPFSNFLFVRITLFIIVASITVEKIQRLRSANKNVFIYYEISNLKLYRKFFYIQLIVGYPLLVLNLLCLFVLSFYIFWIFILFFSIKNLILMG